MGPKWENNYHKISKNDPSDLKFGPGMYFDVFFLIFKKNWKWVKISQNLAQKCQFFGFRVSFSEPQLYGEVLAAHTDALNDLFFGSHVPWGIYHNFKSRFWGIFSFSN